MGVSFDQVFDEWNSLVHREENAAYKIQTSCHTSSSSFEYDNQDGSSNRTFQYCPTALREDICDWCYRVIDHCDIDRSVVSIALSYFDRYLSLHTPTSETLIQLVAMSSLYLAVKLHSTRKISVSSMASLSQGRLRVDQVLKMELCIIKSLCWRLNPPTPSIYLTVAGPLIDASADGGDTSTNVKELSNYLLELSVCDSGFADKKPSCIAYAAILVAMDVLSIPKKSDLYRLDNSPHMTELCIQQLHQIYNLASLQLKEYGTDSSRSGSSPTAAF